MGNFQDFQLIFSSKNRQKDYSMDNFTALLQQFHIKQQQQTASHEQFAEIIDYIRNERQSKQSLICRKKQQKTKLIHKINKHQERSAESTPKIGTEMDTQEKTYSLQQIKNLVLQKEYEEVEKQVNTVRKIVKQMQNQLAVFTRKDNQIKQLRYSSRRELETVELETTNQKNYIIQMQQKYQRLLQQLNFQKINLEHQNRYLANQLKQMKSITKNYKITNLSDSNYVSPLTHDFFKIEEFYTKKKLQEVLRSFYVVFVLKNNWNDQQVHKKFTHIKVEADRELYPRSHFYFYSKKQLIQYYLQKLGYQSLRSLSMLVIDLHRNMIKNIEKLQRKCNNLNNKIIELNGQNDRLIRVIKSLQIDALKTSIILIAQIDNQLLISKQNIKVRNRSIFQILQKQFKIVDRFKRVIQTLENLIEVNSNNNKQNCTYSLSYYPPFHKKLQANHKQRKHSGSNLNILLNQHSNLSKNPIGTNKCINLHKKCSSSWSKSVFKKGESQLYQFQSILTRNPIQTLVQWYSIVKNGRDGVNLLQTIFTNDLYRLFYDPYDYDSSLSQIQNEKICIRKVEESTKKLLQNLKKNIISTINNIFQECQKLQQKTKNASNQAELSHDHKNNIGNLSQTRYVIESKGYFRRDDYKFLQKLERMQLKKQGLYIPYRYGVEIDQQMNISQRNTTKLKQTKIQYLQKSKKLSLRKPRYTAPESNYISSHRQRLNRADKKIRDLLKNADNLRVKNKGGLSGGQWKKNTQSNVLL